MKDNLIRTALLFILNCSILLPQTSLIDPPDFSASRGFYENAFDLIVSSNLPGSSIKYTVDGSDPITSQTAVVQNSPATIQINPDIAYGVRGKAPGVILRACTIAPDNSLSESITQTYLFINKVVELSPDGIKPGSGWPNPTTSGQSIDYGMDPDVLNDSRYKDLINDALLDIPTISVVTDLKNLFDPGTGIYMNAYQDGINWERPASIELLNPDGSEGFQINAGLRIRGGASRSGSNPKHAFRVFFRSEYGKGKLKFALFGNEGVDEFDKIDLRTSQNYSWSFPGHQGEYNTMNRDVFSRDLQGKMGEPYTRSRYYHLYIDGYYWGLYQSQERPEANFAESYFGGEVEDYDVVKTDDNWPPHIEVTDGNLNAYRILWNYCTTGFLDNTTYFRIQGLNPDGTVNPLYKKLVDIDNLIDYMLIIFFTGNFDAPITMWSNNKNPRNFYAIYNRNKSDGFKFFLHDAEHTLRTTPGEHPNTVGLQENRVNLGSLPDSDPFKMVVTAFENFHPQWLHFKLSDNPEYRINFADYVYRHFFNQGPVTPSKTAELFLSRAREIEMAIIAESARWGDIYSNPPRTKDDDWLPAVNDIAYNYFPYRTDIVLNQMKDEGLYPSYDPPVFLNNGEEVQELGLDIDAGYVLTLVNPNSVGRILYTTDGKDPREIGGNISGSAFDGGDQIDITINTSTTVKARFKGGITWSALHEIHLSTGDEINNLKITEINYHPLDNIIANDTINDNKYEFLELKNTGTIPINISEATFVEGIDYTFPTSTILNPNNFIVLASDQKEFNNRYGVLPFGEYSGQLSNGGETLTLISAANDTIVSVTYSDQFPWPDSPDGSGYSLVTKEINPEGDLNDPAKWRASYNLNGSPGSDDIATSVENEKEQPTGIELYQNYPNPFNPATSIYYTLNRNSRVHLAVYDLLGREVSVLVNTNQNAGRYTFSFSGKGLASGIYFYRLQTDDKIITKKMLLLK